MSDLPSYPGFLGDTCLAAHATSALPAWVWTTDAARILWANPIGTAVFQAASVGALAARRFASREQAAAQIARITGTLPYAGAPRLERLRGFGAGVGRALLCRCSRIALADQTRAVLVVALEAAGPALPLAERVRRLLEDAGEPAARALAAFSRDGALVFANASALRRLGSASTLAALGADAIAGKAMIAGRAEGPSALGALRLDRLGSGPDIVLLATIAAADADVAPATISGTAGAPASTAADAPHAAARGPNEPVSSPENALSTAAPFPATGGEPAQCAAVAPLKIEVPLAERRHPLRFVWQMDSDGRFNLGSDEFTEVIGPKIAISLGRPWKEIAAALDLDPEGQVELAVSTRDTWSGITVSWPVDGAEDRLKVELSGLPIYDRNRAFLGYRGFGVCRDVERINVLAQMRRNAPGVAVADQVTRAAPLQPAPATTGRSPEPPPGERLGAPAPGEQRPQLTLVPSARNVVPFRAAAVAEAKPALSPIERSAFRELARQLTARLKGGEDGPPISGASHAAGDRESAASTVWRSAQRDDAAAFDTASVRPLLDRLPVGLLVYRFDDLIYANRVFLDWTGYRDLEQLAAAGGLDSLFVEPGGADTSEIGGAGRSVTITASNGDRIPAEGRLFSVPWNGEPALVLMLANAGDPQKTPEPALRLAEAQTTELRSILETASDGVIVVDRDGRVVSSDARAEALFARRELAGTAFAELLAPDSQRLALQSLDTAARGLSAGVAEQREVAGRVRETTQIPLLMTVGRIGEQAEKFCIVLRDLTPAKAAEREILAAKQEAEKACAAKTEFLAKISHEIRTPLNSIIGFSEVMIDERFGPIGNERYREYLKDIRASGTHVVSLLNDFFDLSMIEAGKLELAFVDVRLNDVVQSCVALMQPQANRGHVIVRTSLLPSLRPVLADERSVRQIVLNVLSSSITLTAAGGQVIVSTAQSDDGDVVLRVRDTGIGMSDTDLAVALQPFRQLATAPRNGAIGCGLRLPLTKALADANHAALAISSKVGDGTLVEISFPATRVMPD